MTVEVNKSLGKVAAYRGINRLPKSEFVLFLDGDDFFDDTWAQWIPELDTRYVYYYDLCVFHEERKVYRLSNPKIHCVDCERLLHNLVLLPKACWIIPSNWINDYLQIPAGVQFEDFWFSICTYTKHLEVKRLDYTWYMYRQHRQQTFGQLNRGGRQLFNYRAQRILASIKAVRLSNDKFKHALEWQQKRYEVLLSGNYWNIFLALGS